MHNRDILACKTPYGRGCMKIGFFQNFPGIFCRRMLLPLSLLVLATSFSLQAAEKKVKTKSKPLAQMTSMEFFQRGDQSTLELTFDRKDVDAKKFQLQEDKQIIIDLKNTVATDKVMRAFDTSEFSGSVVFVSAYKRPGKENDLRIALQLRDNVRSIMSKDDNKIILDVENRFGVFSQKQVQLGALNPDHQTLEEESTDIGNLLVPKSNKIEDILDNLTLSGKKKYVGKKITLNVKDMRVEEILKIIADASGFNIIVGDEVKNLPNLTLNLTAIPWDQVLDTILALNKLVARKNGEILMVTTLAKATSEEKLQIEAKQLAQSQEALVTKVFPISHAELGPLSSIVKEYLTTRGKLSQDDRTNALIIKDTADTLEKIIKIIELLDVQTPQVLIEARIVEVSEFYGLNLGLRQGISWQYDPIGSPARNKDSGAAGAFNFSTAPIAGSEGSTGDDTASANQVFSLAGLTLGRVKDLNFQLQMLEQESKGKVISAPKVITQNKKAATITSSEGRSYQKTTGSGDSATTSYETIDATLSLNVTPQITNEGSILMQVNVSQTSFKPQVSDTKPPDSTSKTVTTNVLVDNGSTVVIGGIYNYNESLKNEGIPFLKNLPLIGWLFRSAYSPTHEKTEMVIFLTPRIINQEQAGLTDARQ